MGEQKVIKKIVLIITAILAIGLFIFISKVNKEELKQQARNDEIEEMLRPFTVKKDSLNSELEQLEEEHNNKTKPKGTTQVIFTGLEEEVYTACYPIMQEHNYDGILALSWKQFPGAEGCMTLEQFQELITAGWKICVKWDSETPVAQWWPTLQQKLTELGVSAGQIVYFTTGTYSSTLDAQLKELGFTIVVHHGEEVESLIQTKDEDGIWHLGSVGLMGLKPKVRLHEAIAQTGNIIYLVGFELEDELYHERQFRNMLKYFELYENSYELQVTTIEEAREIYRLRALGQDVIVDEEYEKKRAELIAEIEKTEAEIAKIEAQEE